MRKMTRMMRTAIMSICGAALVALASCTGSTADNPASSHSKALEGEWIVEKPSDGIEFAFGAALEGREISKDIDQYALIYHFYEWGEGFCELYLLKQGEVTDMLWSRYENKFKYQEDSKGQVLLSYIDIDEKPTGMTETLTFDGKNLKKADEEIIIVFDRATEQQEAKYRAVSDEYHGGSDEGRVVDLSTSPSGYVTAYDGEIITGKLRYTKSFEIWHRATVTLRDVTIGEDGDGQSEWPGIECIGDATIILEGNNRIYAGAPQFPAIYVPIGSKLTIKGTGSLHAESLKGGAGIGGGYDYTYTDCGDIVIEGGNIVAIGKDYPYGIGLDGDNSGNIVIKATVGSLKSHGLSKNDKVTIEKGANVIDE